MNPGTTVDEYRVLLKSLADQVERIRDQRLDDLGLSQKASGMDRIYRRIVALPAETIWEQAIRRNVSLVDRVTVMRQADDVLKRLAAGSGGISLGPDIGRLRNLVAGLPGDDPTSF